jgi:hypothetical protein
MVVDPWNCWGAGQLFAYAGELAALAAPDAPAAARR